MSPIVDGGVSPVFAAETRVSAAPLPRLFQGALSEYHLGRADEDTLPSTLTERLVPVWVERDGKRQHVVPLRALQPQTEYELVTEPGRSVRFHVGARQPELLRAWPGETTGRVAVYCTRDGSSLSLGATSSTDLLHTQAAVELHPVPARPDCARLNVTGALPVNGSVTRALLFGRLTEPVLFNGQLSQLGELTARGATCQAGEQSLAAGCVQIQDDRIVVRSPSLDTVWMFGGDFEAAVFVQSGQAAVLRGFFAATRYRLELEVFAADGSVWRVRPELQTASARSHLVISEVFANPLGAEPDQEWVELVNDGAHAVELEGYVLSDSAGETPLPAQLVEPGQYVLVVNESFVAQSDWDLAPVADVVLVRVAKLGKSGLSNSGEPLQLRSPEGDVVSRVPARACEAGSSLARTAPSAPDGDEASFAVSATPTPGTSNDAPLAP